MSPSKILLGSALLTCAAISAAQNSVKIVPKWDKEAKLKLKHNFEIEIGEHHAKIDGVSLWSGLVEDEAVSLTIHPEQLTIVADDNEVTPPYEDFKISFNKLGGIAKFAGGIDGSDGLRMLLVGHFFAPKDELVRDKATKWVIRADSRMSDIQDLNIETTFLGTEEVGNQKGFRFKQVMSEEKGEYGTEGTYTVNANGQVLKAEVTFRGMPIPAAGGAAKGKFKASVVE